MLPQMLFQVLWQTDSGTFVAVIKDLDSSASCQVRLSAEVNNGKVTRVTENTKVGIFLQQSSLSHSLINAFFFK